MRIPKFPIFTINLKKFPWKWIAALVVTSLLVYGNIYIFEELTRLPPGEAVLQGLSKTINAQSYRFEALAKRTLEGKETVISEVKGEKNIKGVHIKGILPIIQSEVEVYHLGDVMYRRDTFTQGWLEVPNKSRAAVEQLISEINPLGVFRFSDDIDVKYVGKEKVGKKACRVYEVMGRGENKFMELYWQDFNYRLWIDKKEGVIRKAEVMAEHRDNSQHRLGVTILLYDLNEPVEIIPPKAPEVPAPQVPGT